MTAAGSVVELINAKTQTETLEITADGFIEAGYNKGRVGMAT
jgi:hypothetical protein